LDKATFARIYGEDTPLFKLAWFQKEQANESDRGRVLVVTAFIEDLVSELLLSYLPDIPSTKELLIGHNAPVSNLSGKVALARSLGLLKAEEYEAIHTVRKIRNKFAHVVEVDFENQSIFDLTENLNFALENLDSDAGSKPSGRHRFDLATSALLMALHDRPSKIDNRCNV
jgi:hypothetical protein